LLATAGTENVPAVFFYCEALGLIPRRLRRNSKAFFINQYPAPWGGVVNFVSPPKEELAERGKACSAA
jgi:hypothetical protein